MNQDQRLVPFLGGLILGGVGGAAAEGNKMMPYNNYGYGYNYYPPYYNNYQYPTYNYYQAVPAQGAPVINSMEHPLYNNYNTMNYPSDAIAPGKIINENPIPIILTNQNRSIQDISYVPKYIP